VIDPKDFEPWDSILWVALKEFRASEGEIVAIANMGVRTFRFSQVIIDELLLKIDR
jgi:hypothetical protein